MNCPGQESGILLEQVPIKSLSKVPSWHLSKWLKVTWSCNFPNSRGAPAATFYKIVLLTFCRKNRFFDLTLTGQFTSWFSSYLETAPFNNLSRFYPWQSCFLRSWIWDNSLEFSTVSPGRALTLLLGKYTIIATIHIKNKTTHGYLKLEFERFISTLCI